VHAALAHGVEKIKFTGGEPLFRSDFVDIVAELPALCEVSVTTNGTLLSKYAYDLAEAGLRRVNVSLDTLRPDRYQRITGGGSDALGSVLDGVCAAVDAGLTPVKLNMVLLRGINDDEIWDLIDFARSNRDVILQIIELMDFTGICENADMGAVEDALRARASEIITRRMHRRKKYMIDGAEVELVRPIDNSLFCANCNRLRVTSDGKLKGCLLSNDNLISISGASEKEMHVLLERSVALRKPYYSGV
jgi:cyclic pyranopterin phosphate synthase